MADKNTYDQIVFLLQGGGALGTYQAGVCEALLASNYAPNWVIGTSIGAINASIIAGNRPEIRARKFKEFWDSLTSPFSWFSIPFDNILLKEWFNFWDAQWSALFGQPGFFKPRILSPWLEFSTTPDKLSYYDTNDLYDTLKKVIDFDLINQKSVRLSLGTVEVETGKEIYFDNYHETIKPEHIMASAALPPGFPAIKIKDKYYWDGGIVSNTPLKVILEEKIEQNFLCFIVDLFSFPEHIPTSMSDVMSERKNLEYASRHYETLEYFCKLHYLRNTIDTLSKKPKQNHSDFELALKQVSDLGHPTGLNLIRFHYKNCPTDLWTRDFNFASQNLKSHWEAGYQDAQNALNNPRWNDLLQDVGCGIVHEF